MEDPEMGAKIRKNLPVADAGIAHAETISENHVR
jgi:hypothetical protein